MSPPIATRCAKQKWGVQVIGHSKETKSQRRWAVAIYWRLEVLPRWDQIGSMTKLHAPYPFSQLVQPYS